MSGSASGRSGHRRPGHRRPAGPRGRRPGRRPAHRRAADRPLPGGVRPGDAHRDVGAPGHPGQRGHPARPRLPSSLDPAAGRLTGADSGPGRLPEPAELYDGGHPGAGPRRRRAAARPGRPPGRGLRGRHPGGDSTRSGSSATGPPAVRATRWPGPPPPAAPRSPWCRPTSPWTTRPGPRWSGSSRPATWQAAVTAAAADADAVVMAAAVADYRPETRSVTEDQEVRARAPSRCAWWRTRTSCAAWPRTGPGPARSSSASPRRPRTCCATARPSWPPRAATCSWSTRSGTAWRSAPRTTRRSCWPPTAASTPVPRGPKEVLADVVWDLVAARLPGAGPAGPGPPAGQPRMRRLVHAGPRQEPG